MKLIDNSPFMDMVNNYKHPKIYTLFYFYFYMKMVRKISVTIIQIL